MSGSQRDVEADALERLNCLVDRTKVFENNLREANLPLAASSGQRYRLGAMIRAVAAAAEFIDSFEQFKKERLTAPFTQLMLSLNDVLNGIAPEDFKVSLTTRSKDDGRLNDFKMNCAVAMQLYMDADKSGRDAAEAVSRHLKPHNNILPGTIADWRDNLTGNIPSAWAKQYKNIVKNLGLEQPSMRQIDEAVARIAMKFRGINTKQRMHLMDSKPKRRRK